MDQKKIFQVLDVIHRNGAIRKLIHIGYNYSQVANVLEYLTENKLVYENEARIILTDTGIELYNGLSAEHKQTDKDSWIKIDEKNKIEPIEENTIFIPDQNELEFDQE